MPVAGFIEDHKRVCFDCHVTVSYEVIMLINDTVVYQLTKKSCWRFLKSHKMIISISSAIKALSL